MRRFSTSVAVLATAALALTGCVEQENDGKASPSEHPTEMGKTIVVATHDSWNMDKALIAAFEQQFDVEVQLQAQGDAGTLTNKLVLTKDHPIADVVYGVDNTFASRALEEGVFAEPGEAGELANDEFALEGEDGDRLVPVDYGDVCVNIDDTYFAAKQLAPPASLDDLTKPAYKDLFVTPGANTSSPGMAFFLATVAEYDDEWPSYWEKLMANGAKVTNGWEDAYTVDFTQGGGKGTRPIVLSYSSSPPFTVDKATGKPTTSALLDTCFRQVEYAGVLEGAKNPVGAEKFLEFLLSEGVQAALPTNMYVYPVTDVKIPADWAQFAPTAEDAHEVDPADIAEHRSEWLTEWRDIVTR